MPLARQALHDSGEHIHVSVWPTVHEMHQVASRHYAFEARCFILAAGLVMRARDLPGELHVTPEIAANRESFVLRGGSAIIGPDGKYVVEPVYDEEKIISAELDLTRIDCEKMTLDVSGRYSRPDVFEFKLRSRT
jgi:nitrilase